jgi:hypothetical protein
MAVLLTHATFLRAARMLSNGTVTGILHIPVFPFYYFSAVCLVLFAIVIFYDAIISVIAIFRSDYAELVSKNW